MNYIVAEFYFILKVFLSQAFIFPSIIIFRENANYKRLEKPIVVLEGGFEGYALVKSCHSAEVKTLACALVFTARY